MRLAFRIAGPCALALGLAGCGTDGLAENRNSPGYNPVGLGPFNSRGDYIEEWADSPEKWRRPASRPSRPGPSRPTPSADLPVIAANEQPPPHSIPISTSAPSRPVVNTPPAASRPKPAPQVAAVKPPAPKPKPAAKPKPSKPAPIRYTIKRGDTLYAIASRHKTTVTAIQRANGISGSLIQPGKVLVIPRY